MSDPLELMVKFRRGVEESAARQIAEAAGATIRRRMRTDRPDEVMLLLRVKDLEATDQKLRGHADVELIEANHGGYRPM
ncbi:MAG: hypothetical protein IPG45_27125 [Deltaproteobacteria bacterium]|jgi:hypothetical protein|nr:hypothetical protein [Deltaproteobacteria bacterium]